MKTVTGVELALEFQRHFREIISADVADYISEFDEFRMELDDDETLAYADVPKRLSYQWDILAPEKVRPGKMIELSVQVNSDLGPKIIGTYRLPVGTDYRLVLDEHELEFIPNYQRGQPIPGVSRSNVDRPPETFDSLSGFERMIVEAADNLVDRFERASEAFDVELEYAGGSSGHRMPVRSTRDELRRRTGSIAKRTADRLSVSWDDKDDDVDEVDDKFFGWLKKGREPKWFTDLSTSARNALWKSLRSSGHILFRPFAKWWKSENKTKPKQSDFWAWFSWWLVTEKNKLNGYCPKHDISIKLDKHGVCDNTRCSLHPSHVSRSFGKNKFCHYQRIKVKDG